MNIPQDVIKRTVDYSEALSTSVSFLLESLFKLEGTDSKRLYSKRLKSLPNDVIISVDYGTDWKGYFAFMFPIKTAFDFCEYLVPGIDNSYFDENHFDILGEFANMISGNAMTKLQLVDHGLYLKPPEIKSFHDILKDEKDCYMFSMNYSLNPGKFGLLFAVRKESV